MTRKSKRRTRIKPRFFIFLALMGLGVYFLMSWGHKEFVYMTSDTYIPKTGTIEKAVKLDALIAKKGPIIAAKADGTLKIIAKNTQQVVKGTEVFQIVNDSIQIRYDDDLIRLDASIKRFKDEWSRLAGNYDRKIATFDKQAKDLLKKQSAANGVLSGDNEDALRFAMLQGQQVLKLRIDKQQEYAKKIKGYESKKVLLEKEYAQNVFVEKAPITGQLSYSTGKTQVPWDATAEVTFGDASSFASMKQQTLLEDASVLDKGQNIAQLVDTASVRLICRINEAALQQLDLQSDYPIIFDDYGNGRTMGKLIAIGKSKNAKRTVVFECRKWIKEFSGISATQITVVEKSFAGSVIPEKSVCKRDGRNGVFVKKDGGYSFVPIKMRGQIGNSVAVEGIGSGAEISVEPEVLAKLVK